MKGIESQNSRAAQVDTEDLLRRIGSGNALLFVGAGFAFGAKNVKGEDSPDAAGLANAIGSLGGFNGEGDLRYASDRFIKTNDAAALVRFLIERFTLVDEGPLRGHISAAGWRRIYTTNYDLLIEKSAESAGRLIKTVDINSPVNEYWLQNDICVHINGSVRTVSVESLNTSFKLSNSSYLSAQSFQNSDWHFPFKKDLEQCSAIVFVGYSLYDIEIQKLLYDSPEFREKTYFVTRVGESERNTFTLGTYGQVLPIGMDAFASLLDSSLAKHRRTIEETGVRSLIKHAPSRCEWSARDKDVDKLLMYGDIPDVAFDAALSMDKGAPILVVRELLASARKLITSRRNLVVIADFGNGKSMFLRELKAQIALEGADIYSVDGDDQANFADLELISKAQSPTYLFIDNYETQLELVQAFGALAPANVHLILSARTNVNERFRSRLTDTDLEFGEIAVDQLSDMDVASLIHIFDNAGLWGANASLSLQAKTRIIEDDHGRQLSLALLSILESPQMLARVEGLVKPLITHRDYRDTVFAISLLETLNAPLNTSLISEVAMNDEIYSPALRASSEFQQLFRVKDGRISAKSSLFAISLIRNQFQPTYIVDQLLKIAGKFDGREVMPEASRIFKDLLRFSIVERVLPEKNKKTNLLRYYEELKRKVPWLVKNPHFWLQYAMTQIQFEEYAKAQKFLDQAYALAKTRLNYHTVQIDTQQARMWLEQSAKSEANGVGYELFEKANGILKGVPNDLHKFWQLRRYRDVYDRQFERFTKAQKAYFEQACKNCAADISRALNSGSLPFTEVQRAETIRDGLLEVVGKIGAARKT